MSPGLVTKAIKYLGEANQLNRAIKLFYQAFHRGTKLDESQCSALITAAHKAGKWKTALQ
jgi:hypothetical protein